MAIDHAEIAGNRPPSEEVLPSWDVADLPRSGGVDGQELPVAVPLEQAEAKEALEPQLCVVCQTPRDNDGLYCSTCGWMFPEKTAPTEPVAPAEKRTLCERYEGGQLILERGPIRRYHGVDHAAPGGPAPITLVELPAEHEEAKTEKLPSHMAATEWDMNLADSPPSDIPDERPAIRFWPSMAWERDVLTRANHPAFPRVLDFFLDRSTQAADATGNSHYVVESVPLGRSLWDAWEDESIGAAERFGWLVELAEALQALHSAGAMLEGLRPDMVVITTEGKPAFIDMRDLLPLSLPQDAPIQGYFYSAPELFLDRLTVDARADLYSFGALLYALHLGRELTDLDFERQGVPKPLVNRIPDVHPALAQVVMKTFVRDLDQRFPTMEGAKRDRSGFTELIQALKTAGKAMMQVRLDIAGWSNTGMVRGGNEDAFAIVHGASFQHDSMTQRALVVLADGMGGYEAGEIASALAVDHLRRQLLQQSFFSGLFGEALPLHSEPDVAACQSAIVQALMETNQEITSAGRAAGQGQRGMGCTAEVVYLDGQRMVVGHVGDSRTYLYRGGRLTQITRDHTLVNRLVELGKLTPDEAATHPRRNELQQALGSWTPLEPGTYHSDLRPGDWVIICSDGLTNHVEEETIVSLIQHSDSAEKCARCLVNLANWRGGSDNCTVVAVRAT